ncbi:MAG: tRNA pseudouridine(55) synthase TruB [Clostridiales bacterium]|nr:tRNA pseudouridine(55) synthase TruB [Clostridiales bacterium]
MTGVICLDKPQGITSFLAVKKLSRILAEKKAGHTGTLDPMATGLLVVMLGNCTRFIDFLPESDKSYTAQVKLGVRTDTLDITGNVLSEAPVSVSEEEIRKVSESFIGVSQQTPPMFSALQKDGKRLYDLARQGIEVERQSRTINISELKVYDFTADGFYMDITCSAGTYVRSLADDIGEELGCGACLSSLRRTKANGFSVENAVTLEELSDCRNFAKYIIPIDKALEFYPSLVCSDAQARLFHNGGQLDRDRLRYDDKNGLVRVYSQSGIFQGLGEISDTELKARRVLAFE